MEVGGKDAGVDQVEATAKTKKQDHVNGSVQSGYDVYMYPQWASSPLQGLDIHVLTVGVISGLHCQFNIYHWHQFTSHEFT